MAKNKPSLIKVANKDISSTKKVEAFVSGNKAVSAFKANKNRTAGFFLPEEMLYRLTVVSAEFQKQYGTAAPSKNHIVQVALEQIIPLIEAEDQEIISRLLSLKEASRKKQAYKRIQSE